LEKEGEMRETVVITGVAGGIGKATARLFLKSGWRVYGVDKNVHVPPAKGMRLFKCDLSDAVQSEKVFKKICEQAGKINALVNNAALQICKPVSKMEVAEWDEVMAVNLRSIFVAVRSTLPHFKTGASIVNVSSVHALVTSSNIASYAASKGAVSALTRALAVELAEKGIRVNAVMPGAIDTPMLKDGLGRGQFGGGTPKERMAALAGRTPLGRIGQPEEIGQAILFLADHVRSSFMTGQALVVDGGATARLGTE
jgi:NAD(P)-dependent dehydrogenase (short-subunit alcohol dehydrogenase family)